MDAAKKWFDYFFSDKVIENLFSNIWGGVERESEKLEVPPSIVESE